MSLTSYVPGHEFMELVANFGSRVLFRNSAGADPTGADYCFAILLTHSKACTLP